ncbi:hypothetical protein [Nitrososphaera viennensis]|uniref:Uncharacterized protein n=2 Tax=Nitrososphaera viennensis TaxID=1034015 RepID=A0A060HTU6_9ARCH|nr:hypothetical protein [Nitrososphaera viennensis]AIC16517.1 hypothetical protein NVIE_022550 [Nitrososphaera viennensis EN76]UVS68450.1 hypothetical protein NWT39_11130 [Nitrososphaera viennensis]
MPKKEQIINQFYDQAWHILELMKQGTDDNYVIEKQKLSNILDQLQEKANNADYMDISDFFVAILLYTQKNSIPEISRDDLITAIDERIFGNPKKFHFYFRLGRLFDFPEGYQVGSGKLFPFDKLPDFAQKNLSWEWKHKYNMDRLYATEKLTEYKKRRKK